MLFRSLLLKNPEPQTIVAVGAGAQIQAHLSLFLKAFPSIETCTVFNRTQNTRLDSLRDHLRQAFPAVRISTGPLAPSPNDAGRPLREAIQEADIIITATSSNTPLFPSEFVRPGAHLCLIGSYKPEM